MPVENSTEGVVSHTLDMFIRSSLNICGRCSCASIIIWPASPTIRRSFTRIYSHAQSLAQCREWLDANVPGVPRLPVASNAEVPRAWRATSPAGCITGQGALDIYELPVIVANIEDQPDNTTRFLIIGARSRSAVRRLTARRCWCPRTAGPAR